MTHPPATPPTSDSSAAQRGLPVHDVAPERAEQIRQQAHLLMRRHQQHNAPQARAGWLHAYYRFVEPAVLVGLGLWQLAWTVQDTVALFLR